MDVPRPSASETRQVALLRKLFLLAILGVTGVGLVLGVIVDADVPAATGWAVVCALGLVGIGEYVVVASVLLPAIVAQPASRPVMTASVGYALAEAIAVYGPVSAVLVGIPEVAIPFGILAILVWQSVNNFLSDAYRDTLAAPGG